MSLRAYTDHVDDYNRTHTIEIHKDGYNGSVDYLKNTGSGYASFDYEKIDPKNPTDNPIQKGALEFSLWLQSSSLIDEIKTADEQTFWAVHKVDGTQEWIGYIYNDLSTYEEGFDNHPFRITLMAKDFTDLGGKDYLVSGSLPDSRERVIATIAHLLDTVGFNMPIKTHTSWIEENLTGDYDYLNEIYHETKALREFGRTGDETDQPITVEDALNKLCINHGLLLKQANGAYWIDQLTEYETPASVQEATYDLTASQTAFSTGNDLTVDANTSDLKVTIQQDNRDNSGLPGLKRVKNKYDHRTSVSTIQFPDQVTLDETAGSEESYSQAIISDGGQSLNFSANIWADITENEVNGRVQWTIQAAGYYWNEEEREWQPTGSFNGTNETSLTFIGPGANTTGASLWQGSIDINTTHLPNDADGTITITLRRALSDSNWAVETRWEDTAFSINNAIASENSTSINYQLTQSDDFSVVSEIEDTWFGDLPTGYSPGALKFGTGAGDLTTETWQRKGSTAYRNFHHNLLAEHLDVRRGWRRLLSATLKGLYYPWQILSYDSEYFYFLGGSWDLFTGNWEGELFSLDIQTAGSDTFDDIPKFTDETGSGSGSTSGGGGGGLDQSTADARYLQQSNNLSDVDDVATARDNLDVYSTTEADNNFLDESANLSDLDNVTTAQTNLKLKDQTADLDLNSLAINGDDLFSLFYTEQEIDSFFDLYFSKADLTDGDEDLHLNSLQLTSLTDNRIPVVGASGLLEDSSDLTFDGSTLQSSEIQSTGGKFIGVESNDWIEIADNEDILFYSNSTENMRWDQSTQSFGVSGVGAVAPSPANFADTTIQVTGDTSPSFTINDTGQPEKYSLTGIGSRVSMYYGSADIFQLSNAGAVIVFDTLEVGDDTLLRGALTVDLDSTFKDDIQYNTLIESQSFANNAGIFTGFQLGQNEFKAETIRANELRVKAFVAEISAALYGEDILTKSRGVLSRDFTVPAVGNTSTLYVEDLEGLENTQVFEANDWVRLRVVDRSGGGLQVFNVWGKVSSYSDLAGGEQSWAFTRESGGSASTGDTIYEGSIAIDYGTSGDSVIVRSVIGDNTPRDTQLTWTTNPIDANNYSIVTRTGILDDIDNASGAGFYSENAYLTNSILVGSLDRTGNYFEFDGTNINLEAGNASIGDTSGWFGASDVLAYNSDGSVDFAGFSADSNTINRIITHDSSDYEIAMGSPNNWTTSVQGFTAGLNADNRIYMGVSTNSGYVFALRKGGSNFVEFTEDTATVAGANFDAGAMWAGGDGTKANATFLADWANQTLEMGSVFSADGGADTGTLAGLDFDAGALVTGDGSLGSYTAGTVTGLQPRDSDTTKTFFSGADNKDGDNSNFHVTADGKVYSNDLGGVIYSKTISADYSNNADIDTDNLYEGIWQHSDATISNNTELRKVTVKRKIQYRKRYNVDELAVRAFCRREVSGSVLQAECQVGLEVNASGLQDVTYTTNSSFTELITTLDISSLSDGQQYEIEVRLVSVLQSGDNADTQQANIDVYMRDDIMALEGI